MIVLLLAQLASAEIVVEPAPVTGREVVIHVIDDLSRPVPGATVRAVSRAGLPGEREVAVGLTDPRGRVYWTPSKGGPHTVRAGRQEAIVHVERASLPLTSLLVLIGAMLAGLGALVVGLWPSRWTAAER